MRIVAGSAGGIPLLAPSKTARPTTDRVREALFSILGGRVPGARVLDLFAGSGALGIEALSRGARSVVFVDQDAAACNTIRRNLEKARLTAGARITQAEVLAFLRRAGGGQGSRYDIILADPPYARDEETARLIQRFFSSEGLASALTDDGVLVFEHLSGKPLPPHEGLEIFDRRTYGTTELIFLAKSPAPSPETASQSLPEAGAKQA